MVVVAAYSCWFQLVDMLPRPDGSLGKVGPRPGAAALPVLHLFSRLIHSCARITHEFPSERVRSGSQHHGA